MQLTLAGADTTIKNRLGQLPMVLTEDSTMLRLLSAVSKQPVQVDVRGVCNWKVHLFSFVLPQDSPLLFSFSSLSSYSKYLNLLPGAKQTTLHETVHRKHRLGSIRKDASDAGKVFGVN